MITIEEQRKIENYIAGIVPDYHTVCDYEDEYRAEDEYLAGNKLPLCNDDIQERSLFKAQKMEAYERVNENGAFKEIGLDDDRSEEIMDFIWDLEA